MKEKQPPQRKKIYHYIKIIVGFILAIGISDMLDVYDRLPFTGKITLESRIIPTVNELQGITFENELSSSEPSYNGFAIASLITNTKRNPVRISQVKTVITDIQEYPSDSLFVFATVNDSQDTLNIFVANNGWEEIDISSLSILYSDGNGSPAEDSIASTFFSFEYPDNKLEQLQSGQGVGIVTMKLNKEALPETKTDTNYTIYVNHPSYVSEEYVASLCFSDLYNDWIILKEGLGGDGFFAAEDFTIIDVEKDGKSLPLTISHNSIEMYPEISDSYLLHTVLAPTKSCSITCYNQIQIGEKIYKTDDFTENVIVPVYHVGLLMQGFSLTDINDTKAINKELEKYRYSPEQCRITGN